MYKKYFKRVLDVVLCVVALVVLSQVPLLPDEVRLTKFGSLLRSPSLDELPELWNIVNGGYELGGTLTFTG